MGGTKDFKEKGIFTYETIGTVNGVKVIRGIGDNPPRVLPLYSGDSTTYYRADAIESPKEVGIYDANHKLAKEIDWKHKHIESIPRKNGKIRKLVFKHGKPHVHVLGPDGRSHVGIITRKPSKKEKRIWKEALYGKLIRDPKK